MYIKQTSLIGANLNCHLSAGSDKTHAGFDDRTRQIRFISIVFQFSSPWQREQVFCLKIAKFCSRNGIIQNNIL